MPRAHPLPRRHPRPRSDGASRAPTRAPHAARLEPTRMEDLFLQSLCLVVDERSHGIERPSHRLIGVMRKIRSFGVTQGTLEGVEFT